MAIPGISLGFFACIPGVFFIIVLLREIAL